MAVNKLKLWNTKRSCIMLLVLFTWHFLLCFFHHASVAVVTWCDVTPLKNDICERFCCEWMLINEKIANSPPPLWPLEELILFVSLMAFSVMTFQQKELKKNWRMIDLIAALLKKLLLIIVDTFSLAAILKWPRICPNHIIT